MVNDQDRVICVKLVVKGAFVKAFLASTDFIPNNPIPITETKTEIVCFKFISFIPHFF